MKKRSDKSLTASSEQVIFSDGCRVERSRRRHNDHPSSANRQENNHKAEEIVLSQDDFETVDEYSVKKIKNPYIILSLVATFSLALGGYTLTKVSNKSTPIVDIPPVKQFTENITDTDSSQASYNVEGSIVRDELSGSNLSLEQIANKLINERDWNDLYINDFIEKLHNLDEQSLASLSTNEWFENVAFLVKNELSNQELSFGNNNISNLSQESLIKLAVAMAVPIPEYLSDQYATDASSIEKVLEEAKIEAMIEESDQISQTLIEETPILDKPVFEFTLDEVNEVLEQYIEAYKVGSTEKILGLFMFDGISQVDEIGEYRAHLDKMFKKSSKRHIDFNDLDWELDGDKAVGNGKYKAKFVLKRNKGTETINAETQIRLQMLQGKLWLTDVKLIAPKVRFVKAKKSPKKSKLSKNNPKSKNPKSKNVTSNSAKKSTRKTKVAKLTTKTRNTPTKSNRVVPQNVATLNIKPAPTLIAKNTTAKLPTKAELKQVVDMFVKAYDEGDINTLGSLFAENARTNDQTNIKEIKQDYVDFFSKTTDRQIHIKGLNWTYSDNRAKGVGHLKVVVVSTMNSKAHVVNGTIQIRAQKQQGKVLITHLYHKDSSDLGMSASNK